MKEKNNLDLLTAPPKRYIRNMSYSFLFGGGICLVSECFRQIMLHNGINIEDSFTYTSIIMISLGCLFTAFGVYDKLAYYAGCGTIIPITGFSNTLTSASLDGRSEGIFLGILPNMYKIAGCVITTGIITSFIINTIRYIFMVIL